MSHNIKLNDFIDQEFKHLIAADSASRKQFFAVVSPMYHEPLRYEIWKNGQFFAIFTNFVNAVKKYNNL